MHPPHQNKPPFPSRSGGHPRSEPKIGTQWTGCEPVAPRTCGLGGSSAGGRRGEATPRDPALRIPQQLRRACAGHGPGGQGTKLQEAGPRRGPSARHTKRGLRPGRPGPAHKGSEARAASGPRRGPRAPRLPSFLLAGGGGCRRGRRGEQRVYQPGIATAFLPPFPFLPSPSYSFQQFPQKKGGAGWRGKPAERRQADLVPEPLPGDSRAGEPGRRPAGGSRPRR